MKPEKAKPPVQVESLAAEVAKTYEGATLENIERVRARLAKKIELARSDRKLTQEQFAEMLDISAPHVSRLEHGEALPSFYVVEKLAPLIGEGSGRLMDEIRHIKRGERLRKLMFTPDLIGRLPDDAAGIATGILRGTTRPPVLAPVVSDPADAFSWIRDHVSIAPTEFESPPSADSPIPGMWFDPEEVFWWRANFDWPMYAISPGDLLLINPAEEPSIGDCGLFLHAIGKDDSTEYEASFGILSKARTFQIVYPEKMQAYIHKPNAGSGVRFCRIVGVRTKFRIISRGK